MTRACPRCNLGDWTAERCEVCGLAFQCPRCASRLRRPEAAVFCGTCGSPIEQVPWVPQEPRIEQVPSVPQVRSAATGVPSAGPQLTDLLDAIDPRTQPAEGPGSVRRLRAALAAGLAAAGRTEDADAEYARALAEEGQEPAPLSLWAARARLAEATGSTTEALRCAFEAAAADPVTGMSIVPRLALRIDRDFATREGDWVSDTWISSVLESRPSPEARLAARVAAAAAALCRGDAAAALHWVDEAIADDDEATRTILVPVLQRFKTSASGESLEDATVAFAFARAWAAIDGKREAVDLLDTVIETGLPGDDYPEADAYQMRGELREQLDDPIGAADDLFEASIRDGWRGQMDASVKGLARAEALYQAAERPRQELYWYWSDNLRVLTEQTQYNDREHLLSDLERALEIWQRGRIMGPPAASDAWAYLARATIYAALSYLDTVQGAGFKWRALLDAECALAVEPESYEWSELACHALDLNLVSVADHAASRAMELVGEELDPDEQQTVKNCITVEWKVRPREVLALLERYEQAYGNDNRWTDLVRGLARLRDGDFAGALSSMDAALSAEPGDAVWHHGRAIALLMRGRVEDARTEWQCLLEDTAGGHRWDNPENWYYRLWAALGLDEQEEARRVLDAARQAADSYSSESDVRSAALLVEEKEAGRTEAENTALQEFLAVPISPGDLLDFEVDLQAMATLLRQEAAGGSDHLPRADAARAAVHARGADRGLAPGDAAGALAEVERFLAGELPVTEARSACGARRASLLFELGRRADAARAWDAERGNPDIAMAADNALSAIAAAVANDIWQAMHHGDISVSRGLLNEAKALPAGAAAAFASDFASASALLALMGGDDPERQQQSLAEAMRAVGDPDKLGSQWVGLIPDVATYWKVDEALAGMPGKLVADARVIQRLRESTRPFLAERLRARAANAGVPYPVATPILLVLGDDLIPESAKEHWQEWKLFTTQIPELRQGIERDVGVRLPGVRVRRGTAIRRDGYRIFIEEVFRGEGVVVPGRRFCPAASTAATSGTDVIIARNPVTGHDGGWVTPEDADRLIADGVAVWPTDLAYPVAHLDRVLRRDLRPFLGFDELDRMLSEWRDSADIGPLAETVRERKAYPALLWLLQQLVTDRVPLTAPAAILNAFLAPDAPADKWDLLHAVRLHVRPLLPGSGHRPLRILVPGAWEDAARRTPAGDWHVPASVTTAMLADVRAKMPRETDAVLVTRRSELRPLLQQLVAADLPDLPVIAADELPESDRDEATGLETIVHA